jgi:hypothetical protein
MLLSLGGLNQQTHARAKPRPFSQLLRGSTRQRVEPASAFKRARHACVRACLVQLGAQVRLHVAQLVSRGLRGGQSEAKLCSFVSCERQLASQSLSVSLSSRASAL